jgi:hypothetical protein
MKKRVAAASLAAGLAGGAIAGIALTHPSISGAQTDTTTAPSATAPDTTTPGTAAPAPGQPDQDKASWIEDALAPLVANGTITQAQADAVASALEAAKPERHGPGGPGGHGFGHGVGLDSAASAIGITEDELRTALQSGQSLAEIAQSHGVDPQKVTDALVADAKAHLDQAVASGKITQAEADQMLADITSRTSDAVSGNAPVGGFGFHDGPRPHDDDDDDGSASTTSPTATGASTA